MNPHFYFKQMPELYCCNSESEGFFLSTHEWLDYETSISSCDKINYMSDDNSHFEHGTIKFEYNMVEIYIENYIFTSHRNLEDRENYYY